LRAVLLRETGGPEQLELAEVDRPEPADGQVLVRVRAAGINFLDVLVRQGRYPQAPPLPTVLGSEVAGEVDGRRVMALPRAAGGGYAEWVAVDESLLVPLPAGTSFEEGASFLLTFLTAWIPLTRQLPSVEGRTVLVHAGAGGVGTAAIQLARHLGARVLATASTEEKRRVARELGAEEVYGYDELEGVRADVVLDPVGGDVFKSSLGLLDPLGVVVALGFAGGWWEPLDPAPLVGRNLGVLGFYLGRLMRHRPEVVREAITEVVGLWESGSVRPLVGATFPLDDVAEAHRLVEERRSVGKVVLVP
jgi:NADPH2:quinone reductase